MRVISAKASLLKTHTMFGKFFDAAGGEDTKFKPILDFFLIL